MAEILTESFCERCGSRYTFEATGGRGRGLGRIRTLSRGVKNFVANDDASFAEAMAAAREDDERKESLQQLNAFHRTFNFCMTCRQYTCRNCWNVAVGECLSCAPDLSLEVLPTAFQDLAVVRSEIGGEEPPGATPPGAAASGWASSDVGVVPAEQLGGSLAEVRGPGSADAGRAGPADTTEVGLTPIELAAIEDALTRHVSRFDGRAPTDVVAKEEPALLDQGPDGVGIVAEIHEAVEPVAIDDEPAARTGPISSARAETRRLFGRLRPRPGRPEPEPEPAEVALAAAAPEPEPAEVALAAAPEPEPAEVALAAAAPAAPTDVVEQPTWRIVAPDAAPPGEAEPLPPIWVTRPGVTRRPGDAMPTGSWASRVAAARPVESSVWAASSRDILAAAAPGAAEPVGVHSCVSCGLSLSANARFCRRCGTRQD